MKPNKKEQLQGGIAALFGESRPQQPPIQTSAEEEARTELIDEVQNIELRAALRKRQNAGKGRPKTGRKISPKSEQYATVCVKANREQWEKVKHISLAETLQIKEVLEQALALRIAQYERKNGVITTGKEV